MSRHRGRVQLIAVAPPPKPKRPPITWQGRCVIAVMLGAGAVALYHNEPTHQIQFAIDAPRCERNLRAFKLQLRTVAKGSGITPEAQEVFAEEYEKAVLPAGYAVRTEWDLMTRGCAKTP